MVTIFKKNTYGIGINQHAKINSYLGLNKRSNSLKKILYHHKKKFNKLKKNIFYGIALKKQLHLIAKHDKEIRTYKSSRNYRGLPCRGQRTRTNAKTKKKFRVKQKNITINYVKKKVVQTKKKKIN